MRDPTLETFHERLRFRIFDIGGFAIENCTIKTRLSKNRHFLQSAKGRHLVHTLLVTVEISRHVFRISITQQLGNVRCNEHHFVAIGERPETVAFEFERLDFVVHWILLPVHAFMSVASESFSSEFAAIKMSRPSLHLSAGAILSRTRIGHSR